MAEPLTLAQKMKRQIDRPGWLLVLAVVWATIAALLAISIYWSLSAKQFGIGGLWASFCCMSLIIASRYFGRYRKEREDAQALAGIPPERKKANQSSQPMPLTRHG
jgi:hypothetical protein